MDKLVSSLCLLKSLMFNNYLCKLSLCKSFQNLCFSKAVFYYRSKWLLLFALMYDPPSIQRFQFSQGNIDFYFVWFNTSFVWRLDLRTNLGISLIKSSWQFYSLIYLMVEINWCSYFAHSVSNNDYLPVWLLKALNFSSDFESSTKFKASCFFYVWIKVIKNFLSKEITNSSFDQWLCECVVTTSEGNFTFG